MKTLVRAALACWIACCSALPALAADTPAPAPAKVMLIGLFHFANPGLDAVKYTPIDVMQPGEQAYLAALAERIARFKPTRILLEYSPRNEEMINQRYTDYLAGKFALQTNEIYQLGFRIAKAAGLPRVDSFDERDLPGANAVWEYLEKEDPANKKAMEVMIAEISQRVQQQHRTKSLKEILIQSNSPEEDRANKDFYLWLNPVAASQKKFYGADAAANWWQRNFRMYANIQVHARPGERVVVIAGSGHTAILRDLLRIDMRRVEEDSRGYF